MSALDILLVTMIIVGMATLRFGVPVLIMWTVRQIGQHTFFHQV